MAKFTVHPDQQEESKNALKHLLSKSSKLYFIVTRNSRTGSNFKLKVLTVHKGEIKDITWEVGNVLEYKVQNGTFIRSGLGMDLTIPVGNALHSKLFGSNSTSNFNNVIL